jgi:cytochrome c5
MKGLRTTDETMNLNKGLLSYLVTCVIIVFIAGCYYDVEEELYPSSSSCDTSDVTYSGFVKTTMESFCYVCHSTTAGPSNGGVILEGYNNIKVYVDNGKLLGAIKHESGFSAMPQGGSKLSDCTIKKIEAWVDSGAPNN